MSGVVLVPGSQLTGLWLGGGSCLGYGPLRISGATNRSFSYWVPVPIGLVADCGLDRLKPSYRAFSESTF